MRPVGYRLMFETGAVWYLLLSSLCQLIVGKKLVGSTVLGIDLGSYYMKAGYVAPGEEDPFPILLSDLSERKSPHVIAFRRGKPLFGSHALKAALTNPDSTFSYLNSHLLGRPFEDPLVSYYKSKFAPHLEADTERGTVKVLNMDGLSVPVEFIESLYLENLKEHAENLSQRVVSGVVFTVPPYYNQHQRQALLDAADIAGLKVYALINSASAAAILYGTQDYKQAVPQHVLFFDTGATGSSAVVAYIDPTFKQGTQTMTSIEIKSIASDSNLSGHAIDVKIAGLLAQRFALSNKGATIPIGKPYNKLLNEAVRIKHILSANTEVIANVEDLLEDSHLNTKVTREDLEDACKDMLDSISNLIDIALKNAGLKIEDIPLIIPLGGNSRVPFVLNSLRKYFGENKVSQFLNAEESASKGATLYAAALHATFRLKPFRFKDALTTGLDMIYSPSDPLSGEDSRTISVYPVSNSQTESHKGISLRKVDNIDISMVEKPNETALFKMKVSGMAEAVSGIEGVTDSKLKIWVDIDRNGLYKIEPPVALIEYQKLVAPSESSSSTTTPTGSSTTPQSSSTASSAAPTTTKEPVLTKFTESRPLKFVVEDLKPRLSDSVKDMFRQRIAEDRAAVELALNRVKARNDLEALVYELRAKFDSESFAKWFKPAELDQLKEANSVAFKTIEEDKPETTTEQYKELLDKMHNIQSAPKIRKSEAELRPTTVAKFKKEINEIYYYANNTLVMHEPGARAQTNEELEKLMVDAEALQGDLDSKIKAQEALPVNEDPAFLCNEFSMRVEILKISLTILKRKVLPPKPTPTSAPEMAPNAAESTSPVTETTASTTATGVEAEAPTEHVDL